MANPPSSPSPAPLNERIADIVLKVIMAGGVAGGSVGAFWSLFKDDDVVKAIASAVIGLGISYGAKLLTPIHKGNQRRLEGAGEAVDKGIDRLSAATIAKITAVEDRYLACQAADCETYRTDGIGKSSGIFTPLLDQVFVPLELDRSFQTPGFCDPPEKFEADLSAGLDPATVNIWQLLAMANRDLVYSQIAILAWGGYGKTTLLRHVTYALGKNKQPATVPRYLPVLLLLRKYRDLLSQEKPPNLPELIATHHVPSLPVSEGLKLTADWMGEQLSQGRVVVMLDGFDEVPKAKRPLVARWLNAQMRAYRRSIFLLTARPKAYTEQVGGDRLDFNSLLWVRDFNTKQRRDFIQQWYWCQEYYGHGKEDIPAVREMAKAAADDLLKQIKQRPELDKLTTNPLLLNMVALFHRRNPSANLPKRRVDLYQEMCLLQLRDRPGARAIETVLEDCDAQIILQRLALAMMTQKQERIEKGPLLKQLQQYLAEQEETVAAVDFLEQVEQISELIVQREPDEYEFAHLSFQEFLAAKEIARQQQEALLYDHLTEDWWKQVILLYVAQVKPSRFIRAALDRGATDLAYDCRQETRKRIDADLQKDLEELSAFKATEAAVQSSRYAQLEKYLQNQQWREADQETYRLMITAVGKEEGRGFSKADLLNFPCDELLAIDDLWVKYSQGKWGFSVQKQIYADCGATLDGSYPGDEIWYEFCEKVGWQKDNAYVNYQALTFDLSDLSISPNGEFPVFGWVVGGFCGLFFSRIQTCEL